MTNEVLKKLSLIGKDLAGYSRDTVKMLVCRIGQTGKVRVITVYQDRPRQ